MDEILVKLGQYVMRYNYITYMSGSEEDVTSLDTFCRDL